MDKNVLITGGASGIGWATATLFASSGYGVYILDIKKIKELQPGINYFYCDVSDAKSVDHVFENLLQQNKLPDILICCAGVGVHEKLSEGDPQKWQKVFDVNVMGTLRIIRSFLPSMKEKGAGDVVIINSVASHQSYEYGAVYAASKSSLATIAETLRLEESPEIRTIVIEPGIVDTNFFRDTLSGNREDEFQNYKKISAGEIASCILFAVSKSSHVVINKIIIRPANQKF